MESGKLQVKVDGAPYSTGHEARTTMISKIVIPQDICESEGEVQVIEDYFSNALIEVKDYKQVLVVVTANFKSEDLVDFFEKRGMSKNDFLLYCCGYPCEEKEIHEWVTGNSEKKFLITDEWTVAGYEFDVIILVVRDDQMHGISTVCQRTISKLIVCQISTSQFSHFEKMQKDFERLESYKQEPMSEIKSKSRKPCIVMIGLLITIIIFALTGLYLIEKHLDSELKGWAFGGCVLIFGLAILITCLCSFLFCYWIHILEKFRQLTRPPCRQVSCQTSRQVSRQTSRQVSRQISRQDSHCVTFPNNVDGAQNEMN